MDTNGNCPYFVTALIRAHTPWFRRLSLTRLVALLTRWSERSAQRHWLAQLDDRMLSDIGVGRADAYRESSKWFWQD